MLAEKMRDPVIVGIQERLADVKEQLDKYVIEHFNAGEGYEDDQWLATKVVGHSRTWDAEVLEREIPRGIFKNVTTIVVDGAKIDEYVRKGKLTTKQIAKAYVEKANKPYVKITKRSKPKGDAEAASLADKLA